MTDSAQQPDATPDGTTPEGIPVDDGDERAETTRTTSARDPEAVGDTASAEDGVPADDPAAEADGGQASEVIDLDVLADSDPRSKAELLGELVVAEHKRDEYLDDLRRSHADFENYRRRVLREGAAQRDTGKADIAGPLLEVLDDLDRTLVAADGSSDTDLAKGVALVASKLTTTLGRVGLERIEATGVPFDPNVHEAVQEQPADEPTDEPVVVQVLRPGYRLGERTLRPAMVVVEQ